jgi:dihydroorotase
LDALFIKCNPPIRNQANKVDLLLHLARGEIDLIETDHAPHTAEDKLKTGASGAMSMPMLPILVEKMSSQWHFDDQQIEKLLRDNAIRIFPKVGEMTRDV